MISSIAAIGKNREIGYQNKLLWNLPDDLKHFKKITEGHTVIMGRKTFESIGRPLPNRRNIIITRDENFQAEGCEIAHSLEEALALAQSQPTDTQIRHSRESGNLSEEPSLSNTQIPVSTGMTKTASSPRIGGGGEAEVFVIGGAQIYEQALPFCDKLYLTLVDDAPQADTYFPDYSQFVNIVSEENKEYNGIKYRWVELTK